MSSREIAELTGKPHNDVLKAIRNMEESWVKVTGGNFSLSEYTDSTGRKLPMYELNRKESLYIATKFNDAARAKLVIRWEELESENIKQQNSNFSIPSTLSEALRLAADQAETIEEQEKQLKMQEPKVLFAKSLEVSGHSILIGQLAKILNQNKVDIGQNRLFEKLREEGYLHKSGEQYNGPTQKSMDLGILSVKTSVFNNPDGSVRVTRTTKVTPKGQIYFVNKFLNTESSNQQMLF